MKFPLYIIFILSFICQNISAQNTLKGKLQNDQQSALDFAELHLLQKENLIKQTFSDEEGTFIISDIPSGEYLLNILYVGQQILQKEIHIDKDLDLGTLFLNTNTQLGEIVVKAEKKLIERKVDRLVFNTANSISAQGMDAMEALSNTPMVKVQNDKISVVGKSNVTIMINDKILYLNGDALTSYLKTLRSDDIEKIEVITAPPAKYEASGNSGLINIVLKKDKTKGMYGTAGTSFAYNDKTSYGINGNINYQTQKWNLSLKANGYDGRFQSDNNFVYTGNENGLDAKAMNDGLYRSGSINLTTNYQWTDRALVGVSYDYTHAKNDINTYGKTDYFSVPSMAVDSVLTSLNHGDTQNSYHTLNLFYDQEFDTLGNKLAMGVNYFTNQSDKFSQVHDFSTLSQLKNEMHYTNELSYNVWSANADLNYDLKWITVETGTKYTRFDNKAKVFYYDIVNQQKVFDSEKSNRFNYFENNYAGYISLSKQLSDKWQIKAGMRFEQTEVKGHLLDTDEKFKKSYHQWFPTAYISYDPNETHSFSANYSKRINRPYSSILNPFRFYSDTYSYNSGNPELNPSFTNSFELNYVYNSVLSFTLNYYHVSDSFDQISSFIDGYYIDTWYNMLNSDNYGFDISYNDKLVSWWETNTGTDFYYSVPYYPADATQIGRKGSTLSYYSQNTFNLNENKTLKLFLNWYHMLPNREDNTKYDAYKTLSTGMRLNFLDNNLNVNLTLFDILNTGKNAGTMYYTDNTQTFSNSWNSRRFSISATFKFGNNTHKKSIKEANFEDKSRSS